MHWQAAIVEVLVKGDVEFPRLSSISVKFSAPLPRGVIYREYGKASQRLSKPITPSSTNR